MANVSKSVPLLAGDGGVGGDGGWAGHAGGRLVAELAGGHLGLTRALGHGAEHVLHLQHPNTSHVIHLYQHITRDTPVPTQDT